MDEIETQWEKVQKRQREKEEDASMAHKNKRTERNVD